MSSRSYIKQAGQVVAIEVDGPANPEDIERELQRVYGVHLRIARWSRRGKRRRAEVSDDKKPELFRSFGSFHRNLGDWLDGAP